MESENVSYPSIYMWKMFHSPVQIHPPLWKVYQPAHPDAQDTHFSMSDVRLSPKGQNDGVETGITKRDKSKD